MNGNYPNNQQGGFGMDYTVDMVFCIDATGSMENFTGSQKCIINMVKENALNFYDDFVKVMESKSKHVRQLRIRVVAFRDYLADGDNAILKNILCAESAPNLHQKNFSIQEPFVVFAATDGCFGYFSTPMEFEGALLLSMMESKNAAEWENSLLEHIGQVAGDDYTLVAAAYGFDTFQNLQSTLFPRWQFLKQTQLCVISELPLLDREARIGLWQKYKENYFRYVEQ